MNFQRINCGSCGNGEQEFFCKVCLKILPSTAIYTYSHTSKLYKTYVML